MLIGRNFGGSSAGAVMALWQKLWWLIDRKCVFSMAGIVVAHGQELW